MSKPLKKLFIIKKFVMASSIAEAMRLDRKTKPQEVWIDDDWKKNNPEIMSDTGMGFVKPQPNTTS